MKTLSRGSKKILTVWHVLNYCRNDHTPAWIVEPNLLEYHGIEPADDYDGEIWYFSFPSSLDNATDKQIDALLAHARRLDRYRPVPSMLMDMIRDGAT